MKNMDMAVAVQLGGAPSRIPANLQINLILEVVDGDGEVEAAREVEAWVVAQKD